MKLYALTEFPGESADAAALVWADDPDEARWLAKEETGRHARVCREIYSPGVPCMDSLIGFGPAGKAEATATEART